MIFLCSILNPNIVRTGYAYVEGFDSAYIAKILEELESIAECERVWSSGKITLRFVNRWVADPRAECNDISSTMLRAIMHTEKDDRLKEAMDWMALSADLLWHYRSSWIEKARSSTGERINFLQSVDELEPSGNSIKCKTPMSPPNFNDPPSLEQLDLLWEAEVSLSEEEFFSLSNSMLQEESPSAAEPQPSAQPPSAVKKQKRKFSAAGLEDDVEKVNDPAEDGVVAQRKKNKKPRFGRRRR